MRDSDPADETWKLERRSALKLTAGLVATGTFVGNAAASESGARKTVTTYRVKQGDRTVEIEPLTGDVPVEELYGYDLPDKYEGAGEVDGRSLHYRSTGTEELQREDTTITFLYDGPDGLSLVVVHDEIGGDTGGTVTWEVVGVPEDAEWIVKDDYYVDPDTGEPASTNYDRWDTDGTAHTVDWSWASDHTDGGVLGHLDGEFSFTVYPAFNEKAALYDATYDDHTDGVIDDWEVLSGDLDDPERHSLDLDAPVTVSCTTETVSTDDGTEDGTNDDEGDNDGGGDGENSDDDSRHDGDNTEDDDSHHEDDGDNDEGGDGENSDDDSHHGGDSHHGEETETEAEKRREELAERQEEMEEEIAERREELETEIEGRREEIAADVDTGTVDVEAETRESHEDVVETVDESVDDADEGGSNVWKEVTERFESDVSWNSSDE